MIFGNKESNKEMASAMNIEDLQFIILPLEKTLVHYAYMLMDLVSSTYHDTITCVIWDKKTYKDNLNHLSSYNKILAIGAMKDAPFMPNGNSFKDKCDGTIIQLSGNHAWISLDYSCSDRELWEIDAKWVCRNNPNEYNERIRLIEDSYNAENIKKRYTNKFRLLIDDLKLETRELKSRGYNILDFIKRYDDPNMVRELGWWVFGIKRFFNNYLKTFLDINEESNI